jgi:hypothetical protein
MQIFFGIVPSAMKMVVSVEILGDAVVFSPNLVAQVLSLAVFRCGNYDVILYMLKP